MLNHERSKKYFGIHKYIKCRLFLWLWLGISLLKTDKRKHCNQNVNGIVIALHEVVKLSLIVQNSKSLTL